MIHNLAGSLRLRDHDLLQEKCLIGGKWRGEPVDPIHNPADGGLVGHVPATTESDIVDAVEAAHAALPGWAALLAKQRSAVLQRWHALILDATEDLARIMTAEQGKPLAEARAEIGFAASFVEFYAEEAKRVYGETIPSHRPDARIIVDLQPIGVAAAITPWNFPAAMITRKIAPALAAGCPAVVKPAPETPFTALALARLAERAGLPAGVLNVVTGDAAMIGRILCEHPHVRFLGFTGSTRVGKLLAAQAAGTVKRLGLELGGNAPFIVFADADIEAAVEGAVACKFRNAGQTCVSANRIFVERPVYETFVEKLAVRVRELRVGDGTADGMQQGPLINAAAVTKTQSHVDDALARGARLVTGGKRHVLGGNFFEPTVLADTNTSMLVAREETFGPLAPVSAFDSEDEVLAQANNTQSGLAAYFYARDLGRVFRVAKALEYGMIAVNTGILSTEVAPFGGIKESGLGREGSRHGILEYLELKYLLLAGLEDRT